MQLGTHSRVTEHVGSIFGVAVAPNAPHLIASASDDETVRLWEMRRDDGSYQLAMSAPVAEPAMCISFSPDATALAAGTADGVAHIFRVHQDADGTSAMERADQLRDHPEEVYACEWMDQQNGMMCTASGDSLFAWDLETSTLVQRSAPPNIPCDAKLAAMPPRWHPGFLFCLRRQPGGNLLAASCSDGAVRLWDGRSGALTPLWGRRLHDSMGSACAFSSSGAQLVSVSKAGSIVVLDVRQRKEVACEVAPIQLHSCCLLPGGRMAACGSRGTILLFDAEDLSGGMQLVSAPRPDEAQALFCITASGEDAPIVAGGEAAILESLPPEYPGAEKENNPMFDLGELSLNSSGAHVLFSTATTQPVPTKPRKQATVHIWRK